MSPKLDLEVSALARMIEPERSALLVIDVQEDFASPAGAMAAMGADLSDLPGVLDNIEALMTAARRAGVRVAFVRLLTSAESDSVALKTLNARKGLPAEAIALCREGLPGAAYYRVAPRAGEIVAAKRLFDGFHGTDLEARLRGAGIDTLIMVGLTTNCCVDATCKGAFHRDFHVFVVSDATSAYGDAAQRQTLAALARNYALVVETGDLISAWRPRSDPP
jgi:nicotinamidase-related amidase